MENKYCAFDKDRVCDSSCVAYCIMYDRDDNHQPTDKLLYRCNRNGFFIFEEEKES